MTFWTLLVFSFVMILYGAYLYMKKIGAPSDPAMVVVILSLALWPISGAVVVGRYEGLWGRMITAERNLCVFVWPVLALAELREFAFTLYVKPPAEAK